MTVIDVFQGRPRVVRKQKIYSEQEKRKSVEGRLHMPEIQGCVVGHNILPRNPNNVANSMDGNGGNVSEPDLETETLRKGEEREMTGSSLQIKKQRIFFKSNNRTPVRNRRKSRWKLKFHHQALPPEYLKHYKQQERKRRQTETGKSGHVNNSSKKPIKKSEKKVFGDIVKEKNNRETPDVTVVKMEPIFKPEEKTGKEEEEMQKAPEASSSSPLPILPITLSPLTFGGKIKYPREREKKQTTFCVSDLKIPGRNSDDFPKSSGLGLPGIPDLNIDVSQNKAFLENLLTNQIEINRVVQTERKTSNVKNNLSQFNRLKSVKNDERQKSYSIPSSGKIMNYSDLPYMGEITLDGIKPRRGRKPKKADICHLIYKNYGQVFPGGPGKESDEETAKKQKKWRMAGTSKSQLNSSQRAKGPLENSGGAEADRPDSPLPTVSGLLNHSEVQNRIINSLLEKRLTQELKHKNRQPLKEVKSILEGDEEPLNLCIRDLQTLKIKLSRKHGNVYETKQKDLTNLKMNVKMEGHEGSLEDIISLDKSDSENESTDENEEEDDLAPFNLVTTELRESSDEDTLLNLGNPITLTRVKSPFKKNDPKNQDSPSQDEASSPTLLWPRNNILFPAVSSSLIRYSKLPDIRGSGTDLNKTNLIPGPERKFRMKSGGRSHLKRLAPNSNTSKPAQVITKRKRSAIFIPPVPAESTTNPTTEVSICKFKFTGGAKPSLQEKKMLSVDSGGNFRYYSGTGDKSMRGYEYFPRESLQMCQENTGCSPSGVFLTASALGSGEKIPEEIGHSGFFDSDFPIHVSASKMPDKKSNSKFKSKKSDVGKKSDGASYKTLREHLLGTKTESSNAGMTPDDTDREDGNSSDQSERDFDLGAIPQEYFDSFKVSDELVQSADKIGETSSRNRRLRKTRKSIAREKLEQTFKEKGFLIQTQQLESAEGATYCKFRQLRKFTRYLFRSWKDYLPGNVRNLSVDAGVENPGMMAHIPEANIKSEDFDSNNIC